VSFFDIPLSGKRLGLLHELISKDKRIALLLDPKLSAADAERRELANAAQAIGRQVLVVNATTEGEIDSAFSTIAQSAAGALYTGDGYLGRSRPLIALAARLAIPASYARRDSVELGGLMSYGASQPDTYRRAGGFVSRVLKGEKPGDIPFELPTRFEFVINLKTARTLGLAIPPGVLAIADAVIE
jgi:putative ABC transport system substrate-binding protein